MDNHEKRLKKQKTKREFTQALTLMKLNEFDKACMLLEKCISISAYDCVLLMARREAMLRINTYESVKDREVRTHASKGLILMISIEGVDHYVNVIDYSRNGLGIVMELTRDVNSGDLIIVKTGIKEYVKENSYYEVVRNDSEKGELGLKVWGN